MAFGYDKAAMFSASHCLDAVQSVLGEVTHNDDLIVDTAWPLGSSAADRPARPPLQVPRSARRTSYCQSLQEINLSASVQ